VSGGATGITINANAGGYVNLRGITIQGIGFGGGTGLRFNSGFALTITNCVIRNHTGNGIEFFPMASSNLAVSDCLVADNGGKGIFVQATPPSFVNATFSRVGLYNNSKDGIAVDGSASTNLKIIATVADSIANANGQAGVSVKGICTMGGSGQTSVAVTGF